MSTESNALQDPPKVTHNRPQSSASGRLDATIADDAFEAGKVCTARIILRNPFEIPVTILEIRPPKSSTLEELPSGRPTELIAEGVKHPSISPRGRFSFGGKNSFLTSIFNVMGISADIEFGKVTDGENKKLLIHAEKGSVITIEQALPLENATIHVEPEAELRIAKIPNLPNSKDAREISAITIAPHCDAVEYFPFKTAGWLLFKPTRVPVNVQITYRIGEVERTQVVDATLEVKPPLKSMIIGAIVGATLGSLAKGLTQSTNLTATTWGIYIGSSIVMSLIATITLSRKTGTQGFITVEDFFGAFVVGTLIGYTGSNYFDSLLKAQSPNPVK